MTSKMFVLSFIYLSGITSMLFAETVITVKSEPPLPLPNLVKNASFEEGLQGGWRAAKGAEKNNELSETTAFDGQKACKISGVEKEKPYASQSINLAQAIPAGAPLYFGFASKIEGVNNELTRPGASLSVSYDDAKTAYLKVPPIPFEDHDWVRCENIIPATAKPIKSMAVYLCYYNQNGAAFWDDVVVKAGFVKLNIDVNGEKIKTVRVFNSKTGLVFNSGVIAKTPDTFTKSLDVPGFGAYYVEVENASGAVSGSRYPENEDAPVAVPNSIPVFKKFNTEILNKGQLNKYTVELPALDNKNVFLELSARLCHEKMDSVAGYTAALSVTVNNTKLSLENLVPPKNEFTMASGKKGNYAGSGIFIVYYSPWVYALTTENLYCPVTKDDKNPFNYKFNITALVTPGKNNITLTNMNGIATQKIPMYIGNCKITVVDKTK
jgi:hypothetical protein